MSTKVKQGQYLYPVRDANDNDKVTLVPVDRDFYIKANREINRKRKRLQRSGECHCPRRMLWKCDVDCDRCRYYCREGLLSLDGPASDDTNISLMDTIAGNSPLPEDIVADKELLYALFRELEQLDDRSRKMCAVMPAVSEREASALMDTPKSSLRYQWLKLQALLRKNLKKYR